ncbi:Mis6-domain-containing protein [Delitschia confertaspora ATCC 74209]|uniref:Mis6-domain-containing protein n=1 Tax=Delitschia confertaspora ATCC 74209 TaxID=1513339 RepID=A0A9P4MQX4_9PLEO|nr:Mis6-domain-containing protein [Delitschia confertaspora ATCC 74209]
MPSATDNATRSASLHDAVEALQTASRTPAKQRAVKVSGVVDAICSYAFEDGLDASSLKVVLQIVTKKTELDQSSVTNLVKSLYPAQRVSNDVVITAVGALGQGKGKPSPATQNSLVKWLIIVHEVLEDAKILSRLYGVLFGMLDMISLRTSLCHMLSLITRRKHVKPFRIQQLLELSRGIGNEPALQGLLRVYKDYYPDIILGGANASRNSFPPPPDPEWRKRLLKIQDAEHRSVEDDFEHLNGFKVLRKGPKRSKLSVIPDVHTFHSNESSVTLEEIDNVDDFVEKLDRIELPGQLMSFLRDPLLQKYLTLNPSSIASQRIDLWLAAYLEDEYEAARHGVGTSLHLSEILDALLSLARSTKTVLPIVATFLKVYLPIWDGVTDDDAIIGLLSNFPFQPFSDVLSAYLEPAEMTLIRNNPRAFEKWIPMYTSLFRHWTAQVAPQADSAVTGATEQRNFIELVAHVSDLSLSIIASTPPLTNSPTVASILTFFEVVSTSSVPKVIPIILPPPQLIYSLVMSSSATILARTCGILANYKSAFDTHPTPISQYYPTAMTNRFNGYLMDTCNLIWRSRALLTADANSVGFYCSPAVREALNTYLLKMDREYGVSFAFGLSHNPLLSSLSAATWRSLEDAMIEKEGYDRHAVNRHKGPPTQRSLAVLAKEGGVDIPWKQYRIHVLRWLDERACGGIKNLMFATMTGLKDAAVT